MVIKSQNLDYLYLDDGEQGIPGQAGNSYYTWIKYAHDSSGTGMTDSSVGMEYIGIAYNKSSATESTNPSDYAWSKIQGENGQDGYTVILSNENISFSVGVNSKPLDNQSYTCDITVLIGATPKTDFTVGTPTGIPTGITATTSGKRVTVSVSTSTAIPNNTGSITVPITIDGNTIHRVITYSLSVAGENGQPGEKGETGDDGVSITNAIPEYYKSSSSTQLIGGEWSEQKPEIEAGYYLWTRQKNTLSDNTTAYSPATCDVTMSGVLVNVDNNTKSITNKVWSTDISTAINDYNGGEGSASGTIKDRLSLAEQDISGFKNTVSEMTTRFDGDEAWIETVESTAEQAADHFTWLVRSGSSQSSLTLTDSAVTAITNQFVIKDPAGSATIIEGGKIKTGSISADMIATDAIKSRNFEEESDSNSPFSFTGTFLNLTDGSLYTPHFGIQPNGDTYISGQIIATSGQIGQNSLGNYWEIGNARDYFMRDSAVIQSHGTAYIQAGEWQISNNKINTQKYQSDSSSTRLLYYLDTSSNEWYDYGMKIPTDFSEPSTEDGRADVFHKSVFYARKFNATAIEPIPTYNTDDESWDCLFSVDAHGNIYENGVALSDKYMLREGDKPDFSGVLTINNQTYNGTVNVTISTMGVAYGGTGKDSWTANGIVYASASNTLSQLGVGTSGQVLKSNGSAAPGWVNQSSLAVGSATKATQDGSGNVITSTYRSLANNTFDSATITDLSVGNIVSTGAIRATNGIYGDLTGTASKATIATKILDTDGTHEITVRYSGTGVDSANWFPAYSGYNIVPISAANLRTAIAALPLAGGTMTGSITFNKVNNAIKYTGTKNTYDMIKFIDNTGDTSGNGIAIGGAGLVIIGGGESSNYIADDYSSGGTEELALGSDGGIKFYTNTQDGTEKAFKAYWNSSGTLYPMTTNTGSLGASSYKWANVYATTLHGNLDARTFTIGNTGKSVNWSGNVSWSKADISGVAQPAANDSTVTSNAGWMSGADKFKLDSITVTSGGQIATKNITVERGLQDASKVEGVYQLGHSNSITAGTTSGTSNTGNVAFGSTVTLPKITYDAYGHITKAETYTFKLPDAPTTITGNAGTATKFASAQSVTLTGDTTGTASSQAGWSIATTTKKLRTLGRKTSMDVDLGTTDYNSCLTYMHADANTTTHKPPGDCEVLNFGWDNGSNSHWGAQLAISDHSKPEIYTRGCNNGTWDTAWQTILDSNNYTSYTVTKTGGGASGSWGISITGNAATATSANTAAALTGITAGRFVIGNGTSSVYASSQMSYYNNVDITAHSHTVKRNGIHIWGQTYGNDPDYLVSGVKGILSWGDGGPQITFDTNGTPGAGQSGALIFTDNDGVATGASFNFVSNQSDWSVTSKRFVARTSVSIGIDPQHSSAGMQQVYNATTKSLDFVFY